MVGLAPSYIGSGTYNGLLEDLFVTATEGLLFEMVGCVRLCRGVILSVHLCFCLERLEHTAV